MGSILDAGLFCACQKTEDIMFDNDPRELSPKDLANMTDDDVAAAASDTTLPRGAQRFMQDVLMERYAQHLQVFFPNL